ncbi:hypothetical protein GCM10027341_52280 [Spirosoma knui]
MNKTIAFITGLLVGIFLVYIFTKATSEASPQTPSHSPTKQSKSRRKTLINNERVQVIDYTLIPGDQAPGRHTHQYPHVDVILAGGSVVVNNADGTTTHLTAITDSVYYRSAPVTHEPINTGSKPIQMIEVHIK